MWVSIRSLLSPKVGRYPMLVMLSWFGDFYLKTVFFAQLAEEVGMALSILPEREIGTYYQVLYVEPADEDFIYEFLRRHGGDFFCERVAGGVVDALGFEEPEPFPHR